MCIKSRFFLLRIRWLLRICFLGVRGCFLGNSRIPYYVILGLDPRISIEILEFLEIASVALLPRNDAGNSRIPSIRDPPIKSGDDKKRKSGDFYRDCPVKPDNDKRFEILGSNRGMTQWEF